MEYNILFGPNLEVTLTEKELEEYPTLWNNIQDLLDQDIIDLTGSYNEPQYLVYVLQPQLQKNLTFAATDYMKLIHAANYLDAKKQLPIIAENIIYWLFNAVQNQWLNQKKILPPTAIDQAKQNMLNALYDVFELIPVEMGNYVASFAPSLSKWYTILNNFFRPIENIHINIERNASRTAVDFSPDLSNIISFTYETSLTHNVNNIKVYDGHYFKKYESQMVHVAPYVAINKDRVILIDDHRIVAVARGGQRYIRRSRNGQYRLVNINTDVIYSNDNYFNYSPLMKYVIPTTFMLGTLYTIIESTSGVKMSITLPSRVESAVNVHPPYILDYKQELYILFTLEEGIWTNIIIFANGYNISMVNDTGETINNFILPYRPIAVSEKYILCAQNSTILELWAWGINKTPILLDTTDVRQQLMDEYGIFQTADIKLYQAVPGTDDKWGLIYTVDDYLYVIAYKMNKYKNIKSVLDKIIV